MFGNDSNPKQPRRLQLESLESRELLTINLSAESQLLLELVNRARADPAAEIRRNLAFAQADPDVDATDWVTELNQDVGEDDTITEDPKQPLAPNEALATAMNKHVLDMLARNYFSHDSPEGSSPSGRARAAGYPTGAGENIAWFGNSTGLNNTEEVYKRHQGLVASVGHRINLMRDNWREIGPAVAFGDYTQDVRTFDSIMVGTLFGNQGGNNYITGVAITDSVVRNNFYEIGEGIRDVTITATHNGTGEVYSDSTGLSGGYSLQVPDGSYTVTATGGSLPGTLTVRGVEVNDENAKVDFNQAGMPTRLIAGQFFEDRNENRRRDSNEVVFENRTAYIDTNENEIFDRGEPSVVSDALGNYVFDGLLPGDYTVRQVLPDDWISTQFGTYVIPLDTQNIVGVDFGSRSTNARPIANDDLATVTSGQPIVISALANDSDSDGTLDASSLQIERAPRNGSVVLTNQNTFEYTSDSDFSGSETFTYTVADDTGARSESGTVRLTVTPTLPFQNPVNPLDVDGDGFVVSRDALLIINEINRSGSYSLVNRTPTDDKPFKYDVSGDEFLSAIDAFRVIQFINLQTSGSGEPPVSSPAEPPAIAERTTTEQETDLFFAFLANSTDNTEDTDREDTDDLEEQATDEQPVDERASHQR